MRLRIAPIALGTVFLVAACATNNIGPTIRSYRAAAAQVQIGDDRDSVVNLLDPTHDDLPVRFRKQPETFRDGDSVVEIVYYRSGHFDDGMTTDDEFTPYVFRDGVLVAIGWTSLGGPRSVHGPNRNRATVTIGGKRN